MHKFVHLLAAGFANSGPHSQNSSGEESSDDSETDEADSTEKVSVRSGWLPMRIENYEVSFSDAIVSSRCFY